MTTARKKFQQALFKMKAGVRSNRCASNLTKIMGNFAAKLQGHYHYYGVCGNIDTLGFFYHLSRKIVLSV
ncbi:MAG: hypothetical protein CSA33_07550 [Desulfobulbus propionicus]|nr:MAG: hypothetical protein CSA33_07550 [Desulfobulbus propionicus]